MNVTFRTGDDELDAKFAKESMAAGMSNLKGPPFGRRHARFHLQRNADRGR